MPSGTCKVARARWLTAVERALARGQSCNEEGDAVVSRATAATPEVAEAREALAAARARCRQLYEQEDSGAGVLDLAYRRRVADAAVQAAATREADLVSASTTHESDGWSESARLEAQSPLENLAVHIMRHAPGCAGLSRRMLRRRWAARGEDGTLFEQHDVGWAVATNRDGICVGLAKVLVGRHGCWIDEAAGEEGDVGAAAVGACILRLLRSAELRHANRGRWCLAMQLQGGERGCIRHVVEGIMGMTPNPVGVASPLLEIDVEDAQRGDRVIGADGWKAVHELERAMGRTALEACLQTRVRTARGRWAERLAAQACARLAGDGVELPAAHLWIRALCEVRVTAQQATETTVTPDAVTTTTQCGEPGKMTAMTAAHWNTQRLNANFEQRGGCDEADRKAAFRKLEFLRRQMSVERPAVLFLLEVVGRRKTWGALHEWLGRQGYASKFFPGPAGVNGIVAAVDRAQGKLVRGRTAATRTAVIEVVCSVDKVKRRFAGLHGISRETGKHDFDTDGEPIGACLARQLAAAASWTRAGGVIMGDLNRVMCTRWRRQHYRLTDDDRAVRDLAGWRCACCDGGVPSPGDAVVPDDDRPAWTRWATRPAQGRGSMRLEPTALIDYSIARGSEQGKWRARKPIPADTDLVDGSHICVSDHAYTVVERFVRDRASLEERRPKAFPIRKDSQLRHAYEDIVCTQEFASEVERTTAATPQQGQSATRATVRALVQAAAEAQRKVERLNPPRAPGKRETPKQRFQMWMARLSAATKLRANGGMPWHLAGTPLQHAKRLRRLATRRGGAEEGWIRIMASCRREVRRAGVKAREATRCDDARLYEAARSLNAKTEDAVVRMQRAWRAIKDTRTSAAMDVVWKDDKPWTHAADGNKVAGDKIQFSDPGFKAELGNIGNRFVKQMANTPACIPAFEAWCETFFQQFDELKGVNGDTFVLQNELTWELFQEVLHTMPSGKAVGAGGFHAELLRVAGAPMQRVFYNAMMADLRDERVPEEWKQVLYALLVKGAPNNPEVVGERREIALMAHDMKLLLQMVRRVSYQRVCGRLASAQAGWLAGYGCSDAGGPVAHVIKQCARLKSSVYLLYIDLATFFPRLDREAVTVAEALHGLPKEVRHLSALIYGTAAEPDLCVTCRYDSAAGLGDGFKNWMGALMGCVLSPDKAKIFLNTVLVAIQAVCKGVRLWGFNTGDEAIRAVVQAGYADDWAGTFESERDLNRAWDVWRLWAKVSGSKLGIKGTLKTAVTGARYRDGKVECIRDPLLPADGGGYVPLLMHDEAYKHLGVWRAASGDDGRAWAEVKKKLNAALERIRSLRRPTINEFMTISNALIGGIAGYYLQTLYITFEQAEEVEAAWRNIYRRKFGSSYEEAHSKPRVYYYAERGKGTVRRMHLWGVGLSAIATSMGAAMADVHDTNQRAAARSAIGLAMHRWGCRQDPNRWNWRHLSSALEDDLKRRKSKHLGDAWMLATTLLEEEHCRQWDESEGDRSKWSRDFSGEQRSKWGRWRRPAPEGDPLHGDAAHWRSPASTMMCEPQAQGGLGLVPEGRLLDAGVVAVGHMCSTQRGVYAWMSFKEARRRTPSLEQHGATEAAWKRQVERLQQRGVQPCAAEEVKRDNLLWRPQEVRAESVIGDRVARTLSNLESVEQRAACAKAGWLDQLARCFPTVSPARAIEWEHGGRDRAAEAAGAMYVTVCGKQRECRITGGSARWGCRGEQGNPRLPSDEAGIAVGRDGWAHDWQREAAHLQEMVSFDDEGYMLNVLDERVEKEELGELPPVLQMEARARIELGALRKPPPVIDEYPFPKRKTTFINRAVQRHNFKERCEWQAKIKATAVYTLDGSRMIAGEEEDPEYVIARAAARHDGVVIAGRMQEAEGADNYLAELAAQLDCAEHEDVGGRIIIIFDATSPVLAMQKFRKACHRKRQGYYVGEWLEALFRLLDRQEVVVFLWQNSHRGDPVNEWADVLATGAGEAERYIAVPRVSTQSASMAASMPRKSAYKFAIDRSVGVVSRKLAEFLQEAQAHSEFDIPPLALPDDVQRTCEAVLSQRSCIGDKRRYVGRLRSAVLQHGRCPFGCKDGLGDAARFTWWHAQFECQQSDIAKARGEWLAVCTPACVAMTPERGEGATGAPHDQIDDLITLIKRGTASRRPVSSEVARRTRRAVGGLIRCSGCVRTDRDKLTRRAVTAMVVAGAHVQHVAHGLTKDMEDAAAQAACDSRCARPWAMRWLMTTIHAGPARVAALRHVDAGASAVRGRVLDEVQLGMPIGRAESMIHELETTGHPERIVLGSVHMAEVERARIANRRVGGRVGPRWRLLEALTCWRFVAARQRQDTVSERKLPAWWYDTWTTSMVEAGRMAQAIGLQVTYLQHARPTLAQIAMQERSAAHKWRRCGGWRKEEERRRAQARGSTKRKALVSAYRFTNYMHQKGKARIGTSGLALEGVDLTSRLELVIEPRARRRQARRAHGTDDRRVRPRSEFQRGAAPNARNQWAVDAVLEVRRLRSGGRGGRAQRLEMRVRWQGSNPLTGLPWCDTWLPTHDAHGRVGNASLMREAKALEARRYGTEVTPQQASGATSAAGRSNADLQRGRREPAAKRRKWDGALRGRRVSDQKVRSPATRRPPKSIIITSDDEGEFSSVTATARAIADIAVRRRSNKRRRRQAYRRVPPESESEDDV